MRYNPDVLRSAVSFSFFLLLTPLSGQQIRSLAVLDFEARGIATHEAASLTDWLRSDIVKIGTVPVVERGKMLSTLMAEQDFQLLGCTSDACAVKIGQLLGVSHMVVGSIGKVGSTFSIIARTIDVETGRIVNSPTRTYYGKIDGLIQEMVPLAYEIVGQKAFYDHEMEERRLAEEQQRRRATEAQRKQSEAAARRIAYEELQYGYKVTQITASWFGVGLVVWAFADTESPGWTKALRLIGAGLMFTISVFSQAPPDVGAESPLKSYIPLRKEEKEDQQRLKS